MKAEDAADWETGEGKDLTLAYRIAAFQLEGGQRRSSNAQQGEVVRLVRRHHLHFQGLRLAPGPVGNRHQRFSSIRRR